MRRRFLPARAAVLIAVVVLISALWTPSGRPSAAAERLAERLSDSVRSGRISDCEALASFADQRSVAGLSDADFLAEFNVFLPAEKVNRPLGKPIGLLGTHRPVKLEGRVSGYRPRYRKGFGADSPEGLPHDQAHHFAAYLILGAGIPDRLARGFLRLAERPENPSDVTLGDAAIAMSGVDPGQLGARIRAELCVPAPATLSPSRR